MNVEIGAEAALFPKKEYISRIFVAVWQSIAGAVRNKKHMVRYAIETVFYA
jgi:hypothetical protein